MLNKHDEQFLEQTLPFWHALTSAQKAFLMQNIKTLTPQAGALVHNGADECLGVVLIKEGRLRAYVTAPTGREVTLYFIDESDITMLSAACILQNAALPVSLVAEKDSILFAIPPHIYNQLRSENQKIEHYTSEVLGTSFSKTLIAMEKALFYTVEQRLAILLLEYSSFEQSSTLHLTHEAIANQLGSAREVVTRLLKTWAEQNIISTGRGEIHIINMGALKDFATA